MTTTHARMITPTQLRKLHAVCRDRRLTDRGRRLSLISGYIGRDIESSTGLSQDEATAVIDWLQRGGAS